MLGSGLAFAAVSNNLAGCASAKHWAPNKTFGLQLYSLRDDLPKDPQGVLKQVASFGYTQLESYEGDKGMFWGMKNTEFKKYVNDLGMDVVSSHCNINQNFERKAAEAGAIGMKYLLCPHLGAKTDIDFYKRRAAARPEVFYCGAGTLYRHYPTGGCQSRC